MDTDATMDADGPPDATWTRELLDRERSFRLRRWRQIQDAHAADTTRQQKREVEAEQQQRSATEVLTIVDGLAVHEDLERFKGELQTWAGNAPRGHSAFNGVIGQMFINQLVNAADRGPSDLAPLLADVLVAPSDEDHARRKLETLVAWVEAVKQGAHPAPARAPLVCSVFWSLREPDRWPCLWTSAESVLRGLGWLRHVEDQADRYLSFRRQVPELGDPPKEVVDALWWFDRDPARTGLDPSLVERCELLVTVRARIYSDELTSDLVPAGHEQALPAMGHGSVTTPPPGRVRRRRRTASGAGPPTGGGHGARPAVPASR